MSHKREIGFVLNGVRTRATVPVDMSTLAMLRDVIGLTGTKYACGEGECGACTIIVDGMSVCSCLMFAVDCDDRELTTIEGLARDPLGQKLRGGLRRGTARCSAASARPGWSSRRRTGSKRTRTRRVPRSSAPSKATFAAAPAT